MEVQERRQQIKNVLRSHSEALPITMTSLAELLGVSVRTISHDLDVLAAEAEEGGLEIVRRAGIGVWAVAAVGEGTMKAESNYIMSRKERRDAIILCLLGGKPRTSETIAEELSISRNTFLEDLKEVKATLARYALSYHSQRGVGIWAEGGEQEIRDMLIHIFAKGEHNFKQYSTVVPENASHAFRAFHAYAENLPVEAVAKALVARLRQWGVLENDDAVRRMVCALVVELRRLRTGHGITSASAVTFLSDEGSGVERLAGEIAEDLSAYAEEAQSEAETGYLVKELLHSKIFVFSKRDAPMARGELNVRAVELARRFVQYAQVWLGEIYLEDDELLYNLAMHLTPAIERARFGIVLTNPLLGKIREQYPSFYSIAKRAATKLGAEESIHFSEDEIGYMTIHLGAAVERRKLSKRKSLSVLLVCGNGVGTASLISMTLKSRLPYIDIVKTVSFYKLQESDLTGVDFVISTAPLELSHIPVLHVSPIMTQEEIDVISSQIEYFRRERVAEHREEQVQAASLLELLTPSVIRLDASAKSWEEAVRMSGKLLQEAGHVTESYVTRMVDCVKEMGAYIIVCPGVAMPHAGIADGALDVGVSLLRLASPVYFSERQEDYADLFFAFSTTDELRHRRLLEDLWKLFQDAGALQGIREAKSKESVLACIRMILERR